MKTNAAVDIAPIKGVSFESYVQKYRDAGYSIIEAFEEVGAGRSKNATGDHWHLVLGKPGTGSAGALADASTGDGGASLTPVNEPGKAAPTAPPLDFEATMARVPPTIERGKAKQYLLGLFLNAADENNKPEWLDALWRSTRKDGTPSFNPEEITKIRAERDQIRERMRVEANQVQTKKWQDNADVILKGVVDGNPASRETIRTWVDRGDLDPSFGYSYINNLDAEDRRAAAEAKADSRQAQAEAENDIDYGLATDIEAYRMGVFNGSTYDSDQKRFSDGELGTGKKAAARLRALNAARTAGEKLLTENPEAVAMAARINQFYKPKSAGGGGASLVEKALGASNGNKPYDYSVPIMAEYKKLLKAGEDPSHAYVAAVGKYGPKDNADVQRMARERLQYLQRKAAGR